MKKAMIMGFLALTFFSTSSQAVIHKTLFYSCVSSEGKADEETIHFCLAKFKLNQLDEELNCGWFDDC